jgi:hypothetical protein
MVVRTSSLLKLDMPNRVGLILSAWRERERENNLGILVYICVAGSGSRTGQGGN